MATAKERESFIARLTRELPNLPAQQVVNAARLLMRHAKTHGNLQEDRCNGHPACSSPTMDARDINKLQEAWDARIERREAQLEKRMSEIAQGLGLVADFGGDPRGYTVKLKLPSGAYNNMGGEGWGVPQ